MADFPNIPIDASVSQLTDMILNGITRSNVDSVVSGDSVNPIQNKAIKQYVDDEISNIDLPEIEVDTTITENGTNPVTGGAVKQYVDKSISEIPVPEIPEITVDDAMSNTSTNPVQNKVVNDYVNNNFVAKEQGKGLSTNDFNDDYKTKVDNSASTKYVDEAISEISASTIDTSMSDLSENPVQNKVITDYVNNVENNIKQLIDTKNEEVVDTINQNADEKFVSKVEGKGLSANDFTDEDKLKLDNSASKEYVDQAIEEIPKPEISEITIDSEMLADSENPVQNKVVKEYVDDVNSDVVNLYDKFDTSINLYNEETIEYAGPGGVNRQIITDFIYLKRGTYLLTLGFSSMEVYDISKIFIESLAIAVGKNGFVEIDGGVKFEIDTPCYVRLKGILSNVDGKEVMLIMATSEVQTLPTEYVPYKDEIKIEHLPVDDTMSDTSTNPVQNKVVKEYVDKKTIQTVFVDDFNFFEKPIWTWESGIYQIYSNGANIDLENSGRYYASDGLIIITDVPLLELKAIYSFCFETANYEQNIIAILVDSEGNIESDMSAGLFINERIMALESAVCELALMGE